MPDPKNQLSDFRWENRLIVTFDMPEMEASTLESESISERKLLVFQFQSRKLANTNFEGEIDPEDFLRLQDRHIANYFLIGLDGGVKAKGKTEDFSLKKIMKQIDSMPMRQAEIQRKKDGKE